MRADIADFATTLDAAALHARATAQLAEAHDLAVDDAYEVQRASIGRRLARGERRIGIKLGLTSRAKMAQVGVNEMIWGRLTDAMVVEEGSSISLDRYIHPRVEPEIAFLLGRPLSGTVTLVEAMDAVAAVAPALEIIDSRYENFRFSLSDVVADNTSASGIVVGPWSPRERCDLSNLGIVLTIDGRIRQVGSSAAILGNPLRALAAASRLAASAGETLEAGWIVMAGSATAAEPLTRGCRVCVEVESLGCVHLGVER